MLNDAKEGEQCVDKGIGPQFTQLWNATPNGLYGIENELPLPERIQTRHRFVEEHHGRVVHQAAGKVQPLAQWDVRREYLRRLKKAFDVENHAIRALVAWRPTRLMRVRRDCSRLPSSAGAFLA